MKDREREHAAENEGGGEGGTLHPRAAHSHNDSDSSS